MESLANKNKDFSGINNLTRFNAYKENRYFDPLISGYGFIFVTKPMLFIDPIKPSGNDYKKKIAYTNMTKDPIFSAFISSEAQTESDKIIPKLLSYNKMYNSSNFIPLFTNGTKSIDTFDTVLEQTDGFDTKQGYKIPLPTNTTVSKASNTVSLSVDETSNMDFIKLINLWVSYISNITDGTFSANPEMITNATLDYMSSIFYFVTEPDGKTLKYWAKYTGCWPNTVPFSNLKYTKGDFQKVEFDIPFLFTIKEEMNPKILEDFNIVSLKQEDLKSMFSDTENVEYSSIKESKLLNKNKLFSNSLVSYLVSSPSRDPLIFFKNSDSKGILSDKTNEKFEISFGDLTQGKNFQSELFGNNYFYNIEDFFKSSKGE